MGGVSKKKKKKKNECLGGLKEFLPQILAWGSLLCFLSKKLCKIKYGAEGSISDVNLCRPNPG